MSKLDEIMDAIVSSDPYEGVEGIPEAKQQIKDLMLELVGTPADARKIDHGNEAYYDQAEGFRMGYGMALAIMEQKINEL